MNTTKSLYSVLNVLIFLVILAISIGVIFTGLSMAGINFESVNFMDPQSITELTGAHYIFMALNLIFYIVFIFGLWKLRNVAKLFLNNTFYDSALGRNCDFAGKSFVLAGVFWWLFDGLSSIHFDRQFSIAVSDKTFVYLFIIAIGLFLMLTSKLFDNALELKTENELTI